MLLCVGSVKWIHCGIIIGPYLEQHTDPTTTTCELMIPIATTTTYLEQHTFPPTTICKLLISTATAAYLEQNTAQTTTTLGSDY